MAFACRHCAFKADLFDPQGCSDMEPGPELSCVLSELSSVRAGNWCPQNCFCMDKISFSSPFCSFAFLGFPLFFTSQAKQIILCWGPNSSLEMRPPRIWRGMVVCFD